MINSLSRRSRRNLSTASDPTSVLLQELEGPTAKELGRRGDLHSAKDPVGDP